MPQPHNLPRQLTSFVGREREMAEVSDSLANAGLVTLTGAGGGGKTRLALRVAAEVLDRYPDGVWLAELSRFGDSALVPQTVTSALSIPERRGRPLTETLVDYLRSKAMLLVLDNCDRCLAACAQLAETLLRSCPSLRILATSREGLGVAGEVIYLVPPLSLPEPGRAANARDVMRFESVRLFHERAVLSQPKFAVTDSNASAVVQVCLRLDGIPLAIELAAARVRVLAVEQIAARLDDRFRLLTRDSSTALPRHRTLTAAMDWSYDLLSEKERLVLARLSVFAGEWTLEAAEAVCAGTGVDTFEILDLLSRLVDKSLVVAETAGGEAQYRLLETVRQYARERLDEVEDPAAAGQRHFDWHEDYAERAAHEIDGSDQIVWLDRLERRHEDFRAALDWSSLHPDSASGLRLAVALARFWEVRGHLAEGRRWLERMTARDGGASPHLRGRALNSQARLAKRQGDDARVLALATEALRIFQAHGDDSGVAESFHMLAHGLETEGDPLQAAEMMERSRSLFRALGDEREALFVTNCLGDLARNRGDYQRAAELFEEILAHYGDETPRWWKRAPLNNLGWTLLRLGDRNRAVALFRESLDLARELHSDHGMLCCLAGLAGACVVGAPQPRWGALLLGAVDAAIATGVSLESPERTDLAHYVAVARRSLGEREFARAWAEGQALSLERALACALDLEPSTVQRAAAAGSKPATGTLTPREREVAALVGEGLTNREIASRLVIAERTAEGHVQSILNKLGFDSRTQVAVWATQHGLVTSGGPGEPDGLDTRGR